jgi:hypothetical protein
MIGGGREQTSSVQGVGVPLQQLAELSLHNQRIPNPLLVRNEGVRFGMLGTGGEAPIDILITDDHGTRKEFLLEKSGSRSRGQKGRRGKRRNPSNPETP